jgi:uncharacterized DUF497 family protein
MADIRDSLLRATGFQWDAGNDTKNWTKHAVSRAQCEQVFLNGPLVVADDAAHSTTEARFFALGRTDDERLLFVVFTLRGTSIRVISARPMSRHERKVYLHAESQEEAE